MKRTTAENKRGIQWTLNSVLEDLDFADNIALLSSRHSDIQEKMNQLASRASHIGMKVNVGKTKLMMLNTTSNQPITHNWKKWTSLPTWAAKSLQMATVQRQTKANQAFGTLNPVWKSTKLNVRTKIKIFKSNVLSVLLYRSECWKVTREISRILDVFQTKSLRRIKRIFWLNKISNKDLMTSCNLEPLSVVVRKRRWIWLGHVPRMETDSLPRVALRWTPQGRRRRGRPKVTWRRTMVREPKECGLSLETARRWGKDQQQWRTLIRKHHGHSGLLSWLGLGNFVSAYSGTESFTLRIPSQPVYFRKGIAGFANRI